MINISAKDVNFYYGSFHALKNITLGIERNTVTAPRAAASRLSCDC